MLMNDSWRVGGPDASQQTGISQQTDIAVQADWSRDAGQLWRDGDDYFWEDRQDEPSLVGAGSTLPIEGSARLVLDKPSQLSRSAVLRLQPPHRFLGHVDAVVLFADTLLIGPDPQCHIRLPRLGDRWVLTCPRGRWTVKPLSGGACYELTPGMRSQFLSLAITLEPA